MKALLEQDLDQALEVLKRAGVVPADVAVSVEVTRTRDTAHGDFASNIALKLAKAAGRAPRDIAAALIEALPQRDTVREIQIAGPGFINFYQADDSQAAVVADVLERGIAYGHHSFGNGQRMQVEFVSANPNGPLHVGHGRGAAVGSCIANLLAACGYEVQREYYVNDAGRQMAILTVSLWLRYLELCGELLSYPVNAYRGDYVRDIARSLKARVGDRYLHPASAVSAGLAPDEPAGGNRETHIDALIERSKALLGEAAWQDMFNTALTAILEDIKQDLSEFGVQVDCWFSEAQLIATIATLIERLDAAGHLYRDQGALWFRSTRFGDNKDRVLVRENGQPTYFASDVAYLDNKLSRGFDRVLYVFGSDHHGYTDRLYAACEALGYPRERIEFILIQFAVLYRGGEQVQMSTRSGSFVTLRELRDEVGKDAARFFYVMRRYSQHLDFDLDLARSESNDNPVYYVQYAHARICSVFRQLEQRGLGFDRAEGLAALTRLSTAAEQRLLTLLAGWPDTVARAATLREPQQITGNLRDLANALHTYYNAHKVLVDDDALRQARLCLLEAVRQVLKNGLGLLDVSTPEVM